MCIWADKSVLSVVSVSFYDLIFMMGKIMFLPVFCLLVIHMCSSLYGFYLRYTMMERIVFFYQITFESVPISNQD